jgi:hypothetical protein
MSKKHPAGWNKSKPAGIPQKPKPTDTPTEPKKLTRRIALLTLSSLGGLIGNIVGNLLTPPVQRAVQELRPHKAVKLDDRSVLVHDLFLSTSTPIDVIPGSHHPQLNADVVVLPGLRTFKSHFAAAAAIRDLYGPAIEVTDEPWMLDPAHSWICIGSAKANLITRSILGDHRKPRFGCQSYQGWVSLPYAVRHLRDETVLRVRNKKVYHTSNSAIVRADGTAVAKPEVGRDKYIRNDFLLVTRIPGAREAADVLVFDALHGPAVLGIALLMKSMEIGDLRYLRDQLGQRSRYYQAVFYVGGFEERDGTTVPTEIRCIRKVCPPVTLAI